MTARVWFSRGGGDERPWCIAYENGNVLRASHIELRNAMTVYKADGFQTLPDGPKAIIEGEPMLVLDPSCL